MALVVGIDLGTQSVKAVVCDERLRVLAEHAVPITTQRPAEDRAEQDPAMWEAALAQAIAGAFDTIRRAGKPETESHVVAIAIAGQLDGCVPVDASGAPIHPALIWQDRHALSGAKRIEARRVFAITGQVADPGHLAPKATLFPHAARYHEPTSYLVERLTGEAVMDAALASTTMLLELATERWSPELLSAFGITPLQLPRIAPTCAIAGHLREPLAKIRTGTPVAVGTGDDFATPLGAGIVAPGQLVCVAGTAEVVGTLATQPIRDAAVEPMLETHVYPSGGYFIENPGWMSGGVVRWARDLLVLADDAELDRLAVAAPPGAAGLTFVPALAGMMVPHWRPDVRGTLHGLSASHERRHIARAVLEGLAFACRDVAERLVHLGLDLREAVLLGGGSRSLVWTEIRADALGLPHRVAARTDTCAVGAAMIAAVAVGLVPDLVSAAALAEPLRERVLPRADLDEPYARYRALIARLGY